METPKTPKNAREVALGWFAEHPIITTFLGVWVIGAIGGAVAGIVEAARGPALPPPAPEPAPPGPARPAVTASRKAGTP